MDILIYYVSSFIATYLLYYFLVINSEKRSQKYLQSSEVLYLEIKYKVDLTKYSAKQLVKILAVANSFIVANSVVLTELVDGTILKVLCGFVFLMINIFIVYYILGKRL
jgi:hypothetical protein